MALYANDGTQNVTVVDGSSFVGAYAPDGSLNVFVTDGLSFVGTTHPSGAMNVTVSPGTLFCGYYAPDGSVYVTEDPTELSGALRVTVVSGSLTYDVDALAWFAAMPTEPTTAVKEVASAFISGLKEDNLWDLIDGGNFLCLETLDQGLVDFKSPARVATTAPGFTSTFTSYRGVKGSGALSGSQTDYIDTGFIPSSAGGLFTQDSAHLGVYVTDSGQDANFDFGSNFTHDFLIITRNTGDVLSARTNNGTSNNYMNSITDASGFSLVTRTGPSTVQAFKNSTAGSVLSIASTGPCERSIRYLQVNASNATTHQHAFGIYGGGLNATQAANLNTRVQTAIAALTVL